MAGHSAGGVPTVQWGLFLSQVTDVRQLVTDVRHLPADVRHPPCDLCHHPLASGGLSPEDEASAPLAAACIEPCTPRIELERPGLVEW